MKRRSLSIMVIFITTLSLLSLTFDINPKNREIAAKTPFMEGYFVPNEIIIGLSSELTQNLTKQQIASNKLSITSLDRLNQRYSVQQISSVFPQVDLSDPIAVQYGLAGVLKLSVPPGTDIFAMIDEYQRDPAIAYAEPNLIYTIADFPDDTDFGKQWALHNTGQTGGTPDADIDAPEAWDIEKGKPSVLIAIVDTGVDYRHPELVGRVRTDIGKDFINNDNDAMDDHGHGTYCAGIAAANTNNTRGIAGICQGCQILPVKVLDSDGRGSTTTVAQGIQYAGQAGARIISMSLGFASNCGCSQTVARAINYAFERGSLLIAASGNNSDKTRLSYPASSSRVMSVGASDHRDREADFSNRSRALDIMAPGKDIYSLDRNGGYRMASGTSAAAPHVAGVAGLIWSAHPALTNVQVWWVLYQSTDDLPGMTMLLEDTQPESGSAGLQPANMSHKVYLPLISKTRTIFGRLNAYRALRTSSEGQVFAPADNCRSEPDCPPGCGAEIVLSGERASTDNLRLLRAFRDEVLTQSPVGQHWITLYQRHRFEAALILASDNQFRTQTRLALEQWLPLFQALIYPDSVPDQTAILTSEQAEMLENVIIGLMERGGPQLRADLAEVRDMLQVRRFVGRDVRDAWHELHADR